MNTPSTRLLATATCVALVAAGLLLSALPARSQVDMSPSHQPIGVASSGNTSTAWFHQPSSRQIVACQTVSSPSGPSAIQCVSARLP